MNMKKNSRYLSIAKISLFLSALLVSVAINAHSGGLNASGCHGGSKPYHCHRAPTEMVKTQDGRNRLRCSAGSRSSECTNGQPNQNQVSATRPGGVDMTIYQIQSRLIHHCSSLPDSFADGISGPNTKNAIARFQEANGITADGIFGPETARALQGSSRGQC